MIYYVWAEAISLNTLFLYFRCMEDRIFQILVEQNEITWKSIILDLVNSEQMDPWDVDVSLLTKKYIAHVNNLREKDLKLSGKVLLAAAILLKIKSNRLVSEDIEGFDRLLAGTELDAGQFYDELEQELKQGEEYTLAQNVELFPHMPSPRKRKISVHELVRALEKALEVKQRRLFNSLPSSHIPIPEKKWDLGYAIRNVYSKVLSFLTKQAEVFFSNIIPSQTKEDKIKTFLPLLHLSNQRKIELSQDVPFGEIKISLLSEVKNGIEQK